jgi:hypothetical protein
MSDLSEGECEADVVRQLRQLTASAADASTFVVVRPDGVQFTIDYSSGSGSNVSFSAPYGQSTHQGGGVAAADLAQGYRASAVAREFLARRPMRIALRPESPEDVDAKREGISREFQSGDPRFDDAVYIDTDASDDTLRFVLASPELRAGVLALFAEGVRELVLDNIGSNITARLYSFAHRQHDERRAERIVAAFEAIVRNAPRVVDSGEPAPADPEKTWLGTVTAAAAVLFFFGVPLYFALVPGRCWESASDGEGANLNCSVHGCCSPIGPGFALAIPLALIVGVLVPARIKGRSDSHSRRTTAGFAAGLLTFELTMFATAIYGWHF